MHLSHPWSDCPVAAGDAANVIGGVRSTDDSGRQHVYLDHKQGMIIMHPDVLLSGEWTLHWQTRHQPSSGLDYHVRPPAYRLE